MPLPKPNTDEGRDAFISRCMGNDVMNSEYPDNEQRAAVCHNQWRRSKKTKTLAATIETSKRKNMKG